MAGYNFVGGKLVKVEDGNKPTLGGAQVFMSDEEFASRGATMASSFTAANSNYGGPSTTGGTGSPTPGQATPVAQQGAGGTKRTVTSVSGPGADKGSWGKTPMLYFNDGTSQSYNDFYATQKTPTVPNWQDLVGFETDGDSPKAPPTAVSSTTATETPSIVDYGVAEEVSKVGAVAGAPIKEDASVQAAGTAEKKAVQDTFDRTDTILNTGTLSDENIYKVKAGYRKKSKLGS